MRILRNLFWVCIGVGATLGVYEGTWNDLIVQYGPAVKDTAQQFMYKIL